MEMAENGTRLSPPDDLPPGNGVHRQRRSNLAMHPERPLRGGSGRNSNRRRRDRMTNSWTRPRRPFAWPGRAGTRGPVRSAHTRKLMKFLLEPHPGLQADQRVWRPALSTFMRHALGGRSAIAIRAPGSRTSPADITFGGGVAGRVYDGGHVDDGAGSEVAPGVWLPTVYTYDVDGRRFLFAFGIHERAEVSRYRHVGPPQQADRNYA
jgi:hypothetical protein